MFDILGITEKYFNTTDPYSIEEILYAFKVKYIIQAASLPSVEALLDLANGINSRDNIWISFDSVEKCNLLLTGNAIWEDDYTRFKKSLELSDEVEIKIKIEKEMKNGVLSVYNINAFSHFLCTQKLEESLALFSKLFHENKQHISFQTLDSEETFTTPSISFAPTEVRSIVDRKEWLDKCNHTSVFLAREQIPLVPQDFATREGRGSNTYSKVYCLFSRLKSILSYVYVANTSNIVGNKAILHFDLVSAGYEYTLEKLCNGSKMYDIYCLIFDDTGYIDRASIARNVISLHCKNADDILLIDESINKIIVANYVLHQKKHVEQYIGIKNRFAEYIIKSVKQLQELTNDLSDGLRTNLVAFFAFIMTVLLTDSIDINGLLHPKVSINFIIVWALFVIISFLYMIETVHSTNKKWRRLQRTYDDLKRIYQGVLSDQEIKTAVNEDQSFDDINNEFKKNRKSICLIWGIIIFMLLLVCAWFCYNNNAEKNKERGSYSSKIAPIEVWQSDIALVGNNSKSLSEQLDISSKNEAISKDWDLK